MALSQVYIDTSVIGGCFDDEFQLWSNGLMDDFRDGRLFPVVSDLVTTEIADAPDQVQELYAELLAFPAKLIPVDREALVLTNMYLERGILSTNFRSDALHIALATIEKVDLLVSWNFRHIVHFDKIRLFNAVNMELGYRTLQIYSPREVAFYGK